MKSRKQYSAFFSVKGFDVEVLVYTSSYHSAAEKLNITVDGLRKNGIVRFIPEKELEDSPDELFVKVPSDSPIQDNGESIAGKIIKMDKYKVLLDEHKGQNKTLIKSLELKNTLLRKIDLTKLPNKPVPVKGKNGKEIGFACLEHDKKSNELIASIKITKELHEKVEQIKDQLEFGVAGMVHSRDGEKIDSFDLKSVSILLKRTNES